MQIIFHDDYDKLMSEHLRQIDLMPPHNKQCSYEDEVFEQSHIYRIESHDIQVKNE